MNTAAPVPFETLSARAFSPTAPIDAKALFAGRLPQLSSLIKAVSQKGQHAIVYGERGVGKTSLVNVVSRFMSLSDALVVRINCTSADNFGQVWKKVFEEFDLEISMADGFVSEIGPKITTAVEKMLASDMSPEAVRRGLTMVSRLVKTIVIIDEFDTLSEAAKKEMADAVKSLSDHAVDATVILVGIADSVIQLISEHESVERALVQIHMPRMSGEETLEILTKGMQIVGMTIEEDAADQVVKLSKGLPHYAHLLGLNAIESSHRENKLVVDGRSVEQAISAALSGAQQSVRNLWHTATNSPRPDNLFEEVLIACALAKTDELGYFAAQDVKDPLTKILKRPIKNANYSRHLIEFCDFAKGPVFERFGEERKYRYRFRNPLLQPYAVMQGYSQKLLQRTGRK